MQTVSYGDGHATPEGIVLQDTYRVVRQVGFGGMGVVYEAVHTRLPGRFAVKVLLRTLMANAEAFARFCREAHIMSELRHPNVVQIIDFNLTAERQPYFVMEYLDGKDLEAALAEGEPMELSRVATIIAAVASALAAAHRRGIIHRDLKPSNIFLCDVDGAEDPFVKVLDFGVSKVRSASRLTLGTKMIGTPHYMAPEQAMGRIDEIDGRTDQFALAAIAYGMLTGRDAFSGEDPVALLYQIVHQEPPALAQFLSWDCSAIQSVLTRALAKDPALRFPTMAAFSGAFVDAARIAYAPEPAARPVQSLAAGVPAPVAESTPGSGPLPATPAPSQANGETGETKRTGRELSKSIDRVPRAPYRAVALALTAVALVVTVVASGWARTLPEDAVITLRSMVARLRQQPPPSQPEPAANPREVAPPAPSPLPREVSPAELQTPAPAAPPTETKGTNAANATSTPAAQATNAVSPTRAANPANAAATEANAATSVAAPTAKPQ